MKIPVRIKVIVLIFCFSVVSFSQTQLDSKKIGQIIDPNIWKISWIYGTEVNSTFETTEETDFILTGTSGMIISSIKPLSPDSEVSFVIKFNSQKRTSVSIIAGLKKPDESTANPYGLGLTWYPDLNPPQVYWSLPPLPGERYGLYGSYTVQALVKNRFNWPEMVRKNFEIGVSNLTPIEKKWIKIRYVIHQNNLQIWIDDRLLREIQGDWVSTEGFVKIYCYEGVAISSIKTSSAEKYTKFLPVPLDGYLNASYFPAKDKIERLLIPYERNRIYIQNIPFLLPDQRNKINNHIDIGKSWAMFGLLEGAFDGWSGDIARWRGALNIEPGRIQFRIPNDQYTKIHLIAAADDIPYALPVLTALFYRPNAGHPLSFETRVPVYKAESTTATKIPFITEKGKKGNLYLITIPLLKEGLRGFSDLPYLEFELTKKVIVYRSFPDPIYYSMHQAGLPSS
ncbi:MAG: hypothetical protein NC830_00210, partial [Candidatus Omnitrophica bacterium]|nr:hypothetical protein [Candidatus Omnitrophota bacterium]